MMIGLSLNARKFCIMRLVQDSLTIRDQPIPCTSLDGTTEAKYFLQFKGVWCDKTVRGKF